MILITTSRRPTRRIRTFCNELSATIPNSIRVNRGKMSLRDLAEYAIEEGFKRVFIVDRWKGGPGRLRLYMLGDEGIVQIPPQIYIKGIKLRREFKIGRKIIKSLAIIRSQISTEALKLTETLSRFFNIPLTDREEGYDAIIKIVKAEDQMLRLSFYQKVEIGPRIKISHMVWDLQ